MKKILSLILLSFFLISCAAQVTGPGWVPINKKQNFLAPINIGSTFMWNGITITTTAGEFNLLHGITLNVQQQINLLAPKANPFFTGQIRLNADTAATRAYARSVAVIDTSGGGKGGAVAWGDITEDIANQTDLQEALDAKSNLVATMTTAHPANVITVTDLAHYASAYSWGNHASAGYATTGSLAGYVPTSRTVNGHVLSSNVTVSKTDISLGNVDNTSDVNKPVSTATQAALDLKVSLTGVETLTNKTLTSPKLNGTVAILSTATELNKLYGSTFSAADANKLTGLGPGTLESRLNALAGNQGISPFNTEFTGTTTMEQMKIGYGSGAIVIDSIANAGQGLTVTSNGAQVPYNDPPESTVNIEDIPVIAKVIPAAADTVGLIPGRVGVVLVDSIGAHVYISVKSIRHDGWVKIY
jgi:hypothetical protein